VHIRAKGDHILHEVDRVEVEQYAVGSNLSELLLRDARVESSTNLLVEMGENGGVKLPKINRPLIHFILSGRIFFRMTGSNNSTELHSGDSVLVFYGDSHAVASTPACISTKIAINMEVEPPDEIATVRVGTGAQRARLLTCALELAYLSPSASINRTAADFSIIRSGELRNNNGCCLTFQPDQIERCCQGTGATAFATTLAGLQFVNFCRKSRGELWPITRPRNRDPNVRRISAALRKIRAHPNQLWTVAKLAAEVGLSRSSFAQEFVNCLGTTPNAYLTETRMKHAAHLLREGSLSCREVATRVGYPIESSFCRAFKRYYGSAPTAYVEGHVGRAPESRSNP
jgi:AraC-like DNA-binding protein/mannose-6-phosphate isomerase-like protein (cupin superfamily)